MLHYLEYESMQQKKNPPPKNLQSLKFPGNHCFSTAYVFKALKTEEKNRRKKCKYPFSGAFQIPLIQGDFQIFAGLQWAIEVKV